MSSLSRNQAWISRSQNNSLVNLMKAARPECVDSEAKKPGSFGDVRNASDSFTLPGVEQQGLQNCLKRLFWSAVPTSSASQKYTPAGASTSASSTGATLQSAASRLPPFPNTQLPPNVSGVGSSPSPTPAATAQQAPSMFRFWVLLGVEGSRHSVRINHIAIDHNTNDGSFYRSLKECYRRSRGPMCYWLSMWRLHYCNVVKFKRVAPRWVITERKDLPTSLEYKYAPRPPHAENPPIPQHEFDMHLHACVQPCIWSRFHDCMPELNTTIVLESIPKKVSQFDVDSDQVVDAYAWGLEAKYAVSAMYVAIYHLIIFAFPFGFWAWWLHGHPNDLQGASVPATIALGLLSLFWSTNGILTEGRHAR
ncbi:uncharacterized protein BDR25DRAFT_347630 [Lindgomyces ingoldianus]|uniref:Uncharacterized protein n=1 Tax=Lindgomyces ingoldianus TaxID=673940 RepID=A0ACB6Q6Z1_9PLEO|nr:uncharacterized protein BDR25DRAFT_347630 [Lindgomyces ingoldianus]KAF2462719.1 hypothetical protein BDR25DRAFT_347630 [Lindgomyces ingoldianus]